MDLVLVILVAVAILAYYGFMRSVETGARIANAEVEHMSDVHQVSLVERTAKLNDRISEQTMSKAIEAKARIQAMRDGSLLINQKEE